MTARIRRTAAAAVTLACMALGVLLAWHYPIAPMVVVVVFMMWTAIGYRWPFAWLLVIPALLPISGFATWTGWFTFEELDLLVLGAAAGGYARMAWARKAGHPRAPGACDEADVAADEACTRVIRVAARIPA